MRASELVVPAPVEEISVSLAEVTLSSPIVLDPPVVLSEDVAMCISFALLEPVSLHQTAYVLVSSNHFSIRCMR